MLKLTTLAFLAIAPVVVSGATIRVAPAAETQSAGSDFAVDIHIEGVTDLYAYQFHVAFDPSIIRTLSVAPGSFLPPVGFLPGFIDNVAGTISFIGNSLLGPVSGVSGSGGLVTIQFRAVGVGPTPIAVSDVILLDSALGDITADTANAAITVTPSAAIPEPAAAVLLAPPLALFIIARRRFATVRGRH
jgi:hypothetical protein